MKKTEYCSPKSQVWEIQTEGIVAASIENPDPITYD